MYKEKVYEIRATTKDGPVVLTIKHTATHTHIDGPGITGITLREDDARGLGIALLGGFK